MCQSLLYHAFGIRKGYDYVKTEYENGHVYFSIKPSETVLQCPHCQSHNIIKNGIRIREIQTLPIGFKEVWLKVSVPRFRCKDCRKTTMISPPLPEHMNTSAFNLGDL